MNPNDQGTLGHTNTHTHTHTHTHTLEESEKAHRTSKITQDVSPQQGQNKNCEISWTSLTFNIWIHALSVLCRFRSVRTQQALGSCDSRAACDSTRPRGLYQILPRLQHLPVTQPACCQSNVAGTAQREGTLLCCVVCVVLCVYRGSVQRQTLESNVFTAYYWLHNVTWFTAKSDI